MAVDSAADHIMSGLQCREASTLTFKTLFSSSSVNINSVPSPDVDEDVTGLGMNDSQSCITVGGD